MSAAALVLADPPWKFGDALPGKTRGAARNYDVLDAEQIARFPLPPVAEDAPLLLWRVASMVEESLFVCRTWGFTPKAEIVWVKTTEHGKLAIGMGRYVRAAHETCIVAARGKAAARVRDRGIRSVLLAPRGAHSAKPPAFYELAERLYPGPRVEIFARGVPRAGWESYGREAWGAPESP